MDKRALKILFDTYWSPAGWKPDSERRVSQEDFLYAKSKGAMFDPIQLDHGETVNRVFSAAARLSRQRVADAFLASLSNRRLEWRSALASYAVFQHMPKHKPVARDQRCQICGLHLRSTTTEDLNILSFERFKWGGVRHNHPDYAVMDLELFLKESVPPPSFEDVQIFREIVVAIEKASPDTTSASLQKHFPGSLKSNKAERDVIVATLGFCDVLATHAHPGFSREFIPVCERDLPDRRFIDMAYPACWWRRDAGINTKVLAEYFGHVL